MFHTMWNESTHHHIKLCKKGLHLCETVSIPPYILYVNQKRKPIGTHVN